MDAGWAGERLLLVRAGVDPDIFSPDRRSAGLRESWGASRTRPAIVCHLGLSTAALALTARLHAVLTEHRMPHRLIAYGHRTRAEAVRASIPGATFVGQPQHHALATLLASSDIFLCASDQVAAGGATLLQAQASSLPVLVPNLPGHQEYIVDGMTGHLCRADSAEDFCWRAAELLVNAPRRSAMASSAAAFARTRRWSSVLDPLFAAYGEVVRLVPVRASPEVTSGALLANNDQSPKSSGACRWVRRAGQRLLHARSAPNHAQRGSRVLPPDHADVLPFEGDCHTSELLEFTLETFWEILQVAKRVLPACTLRHCHDAVIADAPGRVVIDQVLFDLQHCNGPALDDHAWIGGDVPEEHGIERITVCSLGRWYEAPVEWICQSQEQWPRH
jgi:hypothetical protein